MSRQIPTTYPESGWGNYFSPQNEQYHQYSNPENDISHQNSSTQAEQNWQYLNVASVDNNQHIDAQLARNLRNIFTQMKQLLNKYTQTELENTLSIQTGQNRQYSNTQNERNEHDLSMQLGRNWQYLKFLSESIQHYLKVLTAINQEDLRTRTQLNQQNSNFQVGPNRQHLNRQTECNWQYPQAQTSRNQQQSNTQNGQFFLHSNSQIEQMRQSVHPVRNVQNRPSSPPYISQTTENHPIFRRVNQSHVSTEVLQRELASGNQHASNVQSEGVGQYQNRHTEYNWRYPLTQSTISQQASNTHNGQNLLHLNSQVEQSHRSTLPVRNMQNRPSYTMHTIRNCPMFQRVNQSQVPQAEFASGYQQESNIQSEEVRQYRNSHNEYNWQYPQAQTTVSQQESNTHNGQRFLYSNSQMEQIQRSTLPVRNVRNRSSARSYALQTTRNLPFFQRLHRRRAKSFPQTVVPQAELSEMKCAICLQIAEEFKRKSIPVGRTICGHFFCVPCLWRWKKTSRSCPVCRQNVLSQSGGFRGFIIKKIRR